MDKMKVKAMLEPRNLTSIAAAVLVFVGIFGFWGNGAMIGNFILLGLIVGVVPYILITYFEYQKIKVIEDQMPVFLLDLAETQKAGMGLPETPAPH